MVEGVGVSDEQLTALEARWVTPGYLGWADATMKDLVAEVRASHAREAALQQCIDKAEAEYRELRRRITTVHCWTNEDGRQFVFADDVRAALTGTGNQSTEET